MNRGTFPSVVMTISWTGLMRDHARWITMSRMGFAMQGRQ